MKTPSFAAAVCCLLLPLAVQATLYDPATPAQLGDNTIVLWSFDGTVGESPAPNPSPDSADPDLDGANDGAISGGSSLQEGRPGFGTALSIGAARVATPFTPSLINTQEVTMAAWIKPDVASGYIVAGAGGFLRFSGGVLQAGFGTDQDWVEASGGQPASWYVGKWTHVAATFHKGTTPLYVNGTLVASAAHPGASIGFGDTFVLGGAPWDPEKGWLEKLWFTYRDEPGMYGEGVADHAGVYGRLKELAPDLRFMVTLVFPGYWQDIPSLDLGVLSWDTAKRNLAPVQAGTALGRRGTLYNNYSAMLDQPLISFRVTAPVVYHTGLEGYYHWAWWWANPTVNGETYLPNWGPGEGFLVYQTNPPGEFIGSLRYEQRREISEDYDLYKMAEAAGIDAKSYALRQAPGLLEFSDNTGDYFRVRRELLEALEEAPAAR